MVKVIHEEVEAVLFDARVLEGQARALVEIVTLGEDKRLAASARTHIEIAKFYINELRDQVNRRGE